MKTGFKFIKRILQPTLLLAASFVLAAPVLAQEVPAPGANAMGMGMGMGPGGDIPRFIENGPKVGDSLPSLEIYDELGQPVNIRDITKENYTVMVLGCLT